MLVDSNGYRYTQKVDKRRSNVNWRCCVRNKNVTCMASVLERGDKFIKGRQDHICETGSSLEEWFSQQSDLQSEEENICLPLATFDKLEVEEISEEIEYMHLPVATSHGKEMLIDTKGYRYTQKADKRRAKISWRCCVRNKYIMCKATVIDKNGKLTRGRQDHICVPTQSVKEMTKKLKKDALSEESKKDSVNQILDKAEACMDTFDFEMAQKHCQAALEIEPDNVRVLETTGNLLVEIGDVEGAKKCFGRAVSICPDSGYTKYMYLGQVFEGQQAIDCFHKGIDIMLSEKKQKANKTSEISVLNNAIASAYCSIAEMYLTDSCFEDKAETQCHENLESALQYNPNNPEAYQLMASYFLSTQSNQHAKEMIKKSIALWLPKLKEIESSKPVGGEFDPVEVCPLSYLSRISAVKILIEVEEFDVAEEILQMLLEEDDEVIQVWYLLGWLHCLQDTEENKSYARYFLQKAKKLSQKVDDDSYVSMTSHIDELLENVGPGDGDTEDWLQKSLERAKKNDDDVSSDDESSGEEEENMEH
ncbi:uncharacterized protein [Antedon mediterranea]